MFTYITKIKQCSQTLWDKHPCSYTPIYFFFKKQNPEIHKKSSKRVNIPDSEYQKERAKFIGTLEVLIIAERGKYNRKRKKNMEKESLALAFRRKWSFIRSDHSPTQEKYHWQMTQSEYSCKLQNVGKGFHKACWTTVKGYFFVSITFQLFINGNCLINWQNSVQIQRQLSVSAFIKIHLLRCHLIISFFEMSVSMISITGGVLRVSEMSFRTFQWIRWDLKAWHQLKLCPLIIS